MSDKSIELPILAGELALTTEGDGNNTKTIIDVAGGQFDHTEFIKTEDGFQLVLYGEWEMDELVTALSSLHVVQHSVEPDDEVDMDDPSNQLGYYDDIEFELADLDSDDNSSSIVRHEGVEYDLDDPDNHYNLDI